MPGSSEKISTNNFALSDAEYNSPGQIYIWEDQQVFLCGKHYQQFIKSDRKWSNVCLYIQNFTQEVNVIVVLSWQLIIKSFAMKKKHPFLSLTKNQWKIRQQNNQNFSMQNRYYVQKIQINPKKQTVRNSSKGRAQSALMTDIKVSKNKLINGGMIYRSFTCIR